MGTEQSDKSSKKISRGVRFGRTAFIASLIAGLLPVTTGAAVDPVVQAQVATLSAATPATPTGDGVVQTAGLSDIAGTGAAGYTRVVAAYPAEPVAAGGGMASTTTDNTATATAAGDKDAQFHMPYALVLALVALIGLVPVSRRPHH